MIYSTGAFNYAIPVDAAGTAFYSSSDALIDRQTLDAKCAAVSTARTEAIAVMEEERAEVMARGGMRVYGTNSNVYYSGFFTSGTITGIGDYDGYTIQGAELFSPSLMSDFRVGNDFEGNCTPTAATNVLSYYREQRGFSNLGESRNGIYIDIVYAASWNRQGTLGMDIVDGVAAIGTVARDSGYSFVSDDYVNVIGRFDSFADWVSDLEDNYPVMTSVYGYKLKNEEMIEVGHSIVAIGYRDYTNGGQYLRVLDGWNRTNDRYIQYSQNSVYFTEIEGLCTKVY